MQLLILAGGDGTRMSPLVTHKTLFPFLGQPLIFHTLAAFDLTQFSRVIIMAHPLVAAALATESLDPRIRVVTQDRARDGMSEAVLQAKSSLAESESLIIADACTVMDQAIYTHFLSTVQAHHDEIVLPGITQKEYKPGGYFRFAGEQIVEIVEKPGADRRPSDLYKLVLDYFPRAQDLLAEIVRIKSGQDDIYEQALSRLLKQHGAVLAHVSGYHTSLKYPARVLDVAGAMLQHRLVPGVDPSATVAKTAIISGPVYLGPGVRIFDYAVVRGPAYIGAGCLIGDGALVRESILESEVEVGFHSEIARSYLGPAVHCHNAYVGDSIIEGHSNLAAGTILANLRFDNQAVKLHLPSGPYDTGRRKFGAIFARGVKTGIHTSVMPGTVVAGNCILATGKVHKGYIDA